jgi:hypothetical protein
MIRLLFTSDKPGSGPAPVLAHLLGIMTYHNRAVSIGAVYDMAIPGAMDPANERGIVVEVNDAAEPYLPLDNMYNQALGILRLKENG